jgi:hypothetical protein
MDWEKAGWGVPATDLAECVGDPVCADLTVYRSEIQASWPGLGLPELERLKTVGTIFRLIDAVLWTNRGFAMWTDSRGQVDSVKWYVDQVKWYQDELAAWTRDQLRSGV